MSSATARLEGLKRVAETKQVDQTALRKLDESTSSSDSSDESSEDWILSVSLLLQVLQTYYLQAYIVVDLITSGHLHTA